MKTEVDFRANAIVFRRCCHFLKTRLSLWLKKLSSRGNDHLENDYSSQMTNVFIDSDSITLWLIIDERGRGSSKCTLR